MCHPEFMFPRSVARYSGVKEVGSDPWDGILRCPFLTSEFLCRTG